MTIQACLHLKRLTCAVGVAAGLLSGEAATAAASPAKGIVLFDSWNRDAVNNDPALLPVFSITRPQTIVEIWNYHWNSGVGQDPGAVDGSISIYDNATDTLVGTWGASARLDLYPYPTLWVAQPDVRLQPGTYTVVDSDRATWSYSTSDLFPLPGDGPDWAPYLGFTAVVAVPEPAGAALLGACMAVLALQGVRRRPERPPVPCPR